MSLKWIPRERTKTFWTYFPVFPLSWKVQVAQHEPLCKYKLKKTEQKDKFLISEILCEIKCIINKNFMCYHENSITHWHKVMDYKWES